MRARRAALAVAAAVLAVVLTGVLAGCGSGAGGAAAPTPSNSSLGKVTVTADGVQEVTLQTQDDYVFTPDHFTVKPGKVRLTVTNVGTELSHNFRFTPGKGPEDIPQEILLLTSGEIKTIEFTVTTPGKYQFECTFHVDLGQVGTMTVSSGQ